MLEQLRQDLPVAPQHADAHTSALKEGINAAQVVSVLKQTDLGTDGASPRLPRSGASGYSGALQASSPAVTLTAKPRIETLNRTEMMLCATTVLRISTPQVDTSAVWHAAAIVNEK